MHNDNFGERSECASPDSRKYAFVSEPAPAKPSTCQCPHLEGSCGARIWEFGGDPITVAKEQRLWTVNESDWVYEPASMGKKILQAREFGEASPGVQKEERIGDIGPKGNGS